MIGLSAIGAFLTGKLAGPIFAAAAAGLALALTVQSVRLGDAQDDRDRYRDRIENPTTGYVFANAAWKAYAGRWEGEANACLSRLGTAMKEGEERARAAQADADRFKADAAAARRRADELLAQSRARLPGEDECTAARRVGEEINR